MENSMEDYGEYIYDNLEKFSLSSVLKRDTAQIRKKKKLEDGDWEYMYLIELIEHVIAAYYYDTDRSITDGSVIRAIKKIKKHHGRSFDHINSNLELLILVYLYQVLSIEPISKHELKLVLDRILYIIDNRSWIPDEQGYVKWIAYATDTFDEDEKEIYTNYFEMMCRMLGVDQERIDIMLNRDD